MGRIQTIKKKWWLKMQSHNIDSKYIYHGWLWNYIWKINKRETKVQMKQKPIQMTNPRNSTTVKIKINFLKVQTTKAEPILSCL